MIVSNRPYIHTSRTESPVHLLPSPPPSTHFPPPRAAGGRTGSLAYGRLGVSTPLSARRGWTWEM